MKQFRTDASIFTNVATQIIEISASCFHMNVCSLQCSVITLFAENGSVRIGDDIDGVNLASNAKDVINFVNVNGNENIMKGTYLHILY